MSDEGGGLITDLVFPLWPHPRNLWLPKCSARIYSCRCDLVFPLRASWCNGLNPLLLQMERSALASTSSWIMVSFFLVIASWIGVSASMSCRLTWALSSSNVLTTWVWTLLTPMWSAVWRRLFLAFRSHLRVPVESSSITSGSLPNAAWWMARSPSLSFNKPSIFFIWILENYYLIIYFYFEVDVEFEQFFNDICVAVLGGGLQGCMTREYSIYLWIFIFFSIFEIVSSNWIARLLTSEPGMLRICSHLATSPFAHALTNISSIFSGDIW